MIKYSEKILRYHKKSLKFSVIFLLIVILGFANFAPKFMEYLRVKEAQAVAQGDGKIIYGEGTITLPRTRDWTPNIFTAVDAHFFSLDDSSIIFSAVGEGKTSSLTWIDRLLGVGQANAHDVPSDWWKIDLKTGKMERLTRIYDVGLYGSFSPDGNYIAFIAVSGVYVMKADGNNLTPITTVSSAGTLEWAP